MLSLLADESGISVHIAENADPIAPAIKINNINSFNMNLINFFITYPETIIHKKIFGANFL